jgi:hypothetical protein
LEPGLPGLPEPEIIPEKANESKGLLQSLAIAQVFERTGFFAAKRHFPGLPGFERLFRRARRDLVPAHARAGPGNALNRPSSCC